MVAAGSDDVSGLFGLVRISAPEAFAACFVTPAIARLQAKHPDVTVELTTATRPIVHGSGADVEIGVGDPVSPRVLAVELGQYELGLFASDAYLGRRGRIEAVKDLGAHPLVYYVDGLLRVADLSLIDNLFGGHAVTFGSASVFSQLQRAGAGIALLPKFLARTATELTAIRESEASPGLKFVATVVPPRLRRAPALAALAMIQSEVRARADESSPQ